MRDIFNKQGDLSFMFCTDFEENLSDYLDGTLSGKDRVAMAEHALKCPVCHDLLNEVKNTLQVVRELPAPKVSVSRLEARILAMTAPETAMTCDQFEELLTDYLDGFLSAVQFHRWERHAALCSHCSDLPGLVVRSIGACYSYKMEEMPLPEGLHNRILQSTIGTIHAKEMKPSIPQRLAETMREWLMPYLSPMVSPQFATAAIVLMVAMAFFTQTASADGSIGGMYRVGMELAQHTYQQGADTVEENLPLTLNETPNSNDDGKTKSKPIEGEFINQEQNR